MEKKEEKDFIWNVEKEELKRLNEKKEKKKLEEKIKREEKRKLIKKKKKIRRIRKITIFLVGLIVFLIMIFVSYLKVGEIVVEGNIYFSDEEIQKEVSKYERNNNISLYTYLTLPHKIKNNTYFEEVEVVYNFKEGKLTITVDELQPVYHDTKDTYFISNTGELTKKEKNFSTPLIVDSNLNQKDIQNISTQLAKLNQKILIQIKSITEDETDENVIILQMYDENVIYIQKKDLYDKMKYYDQMSDILDSLNKEPGYIHLDIGDYYEPK